MVPLDMFAVWVISGLRRLRVIDPERGDVPGWVMVTIMTAGLVVVIFTAFKTRIVSAITDALNKVINGTNN